MQSGTEAAGANGGMMMIDEEAGTRTHGTDDFRADKSPSKP